MRISCSTAWAVGMPLSQAVDAVVRAGFDAVDLVVPAESSADGVQACMGRHCLQIAGLVSGEPLDSTNAASMTGVARELGLFSFTAIAGPRREQSIEQFAEGLRDILDHIDGCDLELVNRAGSRLEQLGDFRELFIRVADPRLHVTIDTLEFHRASVNPRVALDELADWCRRIVLADAIGNRQVGLGQGEVNVRWLLDQLYVRDREIEWVVVNPAVSSPQMAADELAAERRRLQALLVAS